MIEIWGLGSALIKTRVDQHNRIAMNVQNDLANVVALMAPEHARQLASTLLDAADVAEAFTRHLAPTEKGRAETDRDALGTGFLVDGRRVDPSRVVILTRSAIQGLPLSVRISDNQEATR